MVNHRLLKAIIKGETVARPQDDTTLQMADRRRLNRMAERDVGDWLYARFLNDKAGTDTRFPLRSLISAVVACVYAWWITVLLPLSLRRSCMLFVMNWSVARKTVPCKSKVKRFIKSLT
jgi:exoribonuclease-2